ncbi:MAG: HAD-IA family hydrolase [bacterium]
MKFIENIFFDLDGTLVDSKKDIISAVQNALKENKLPAKTSEEIMFHIGSSIEYLLKKSAGNVSEAVLQKCSSDYEKYYKNHYLENTSIFMGVKDVLENFRDKNKFIVTNRRYGSSKRLLKTLGIDKHFKDIIGGDDLSCLKPSSCPLDNIISRHKLKKDKTVFIGDMPVDVLAGKQAGVITCAVTYGFSKKEDIIKTNPDFVIDSMNQLTNLFN